MASAVNDVGFKAIMAEVLELAGNLAPDTDLIGGDQGVVALCGKHGTYMTAIAAVRLLKIVFAVHPALVDDFKITFTQVIAKDLLAISQQG